MIAVLDWELSTTGQPLADLAYFLMNHFWPPDLLPTAVGSLQGIEGQSKITAKALKDTNCDIEYKETVLCLMHLFLKCSGIPTVQDLISIYCGCRGIPPALPSLNFYLALSMFKMAGIAQVCIRL